MEKNRAIILISHGLLALEMKNSIQMITGVSDDIYCVTLSEEGNLIFEDYLRQIMEDTKDYQNVVVFADLYGGSPCNTALKKVLDKKNYSLISGMNLSMVLTATLNKEESVNSLLNVGKNAILDVKNVYESMKYEGD